MNKLIAAGFALMLMATSCDETSTPRPYGHPRIDLPGTEYTEYSFGEDGPYSFEINKDAIWENDKRGNYWGNISYPSIRAKVQITYKKVEDNLPELLNEAHELAYNHTVRADGITAEPYHNKEHHVHGLVYKLRGDAATATQFFVTDSTDNFIRGVVYFYSSPNADSLKPVNTFMANEVAHLIESTEWKNK